MKITEDLLLGFLKCETSPEEELAILDWLDTDPEHIKMLESMTTLIEVPSGQRISMTLQDGTRV